MNVKTTRAQQIVGRKQGTTPIRQLYLSFDLASFFNYFSSAVAWYVSSAKLKIVDYFRQGRLFTSVYFDLFTVSVCV